MSYIYLGVDKIVPKKDIIGVFDLDTASTSSRTRKFLSIAEKEKTIEQIGQDIPKTFVICNDGEKTKIYLSQVSGATLQHRMETESFND